MSLRTLSLAAVTLATLAAAAPAAQAQEVLPPGEVSTINGQLVPVGEHNRYKYEYKRFNVSLNPLGPIAESYGLAGSLALSSNVAVRGSFSLISIDDGMGEDASVSVSASAPIYFRHMYSGFFLEPGFTVGEMYGQEMNGPKVLVGWHWIWDSGLNVAWAFGVARNIGESDDQILPDGYFHVGYAF